MTSRRTFLAGATALAGCAAAGLPTAPALADPARPEGPAWTLAVRTPEGDFAPRRLPVSGTWPEALRGTFYRNGPARHALGGRRYDHWFDGDGMVHAFRISEDGIDHRGRFVRTEKFNEESAAGRFLRPAFGTAFEDATLPGGPDGMNVANTSVLPLEDELLALWEGGSAHSLDPETLETRGLKTWSEELDGAPFSAHPKVEPDGTIWNFGAMGGRLALYRFRRDGVLREMRPVDLPVPAMIHDFVVTERSIVLVLPSVIYRRMAMPVLAQFDYMPDAAQRVLVIDKADGAVKRSHELPPGMHFHFGNAAEEADGTIRFDYCRRDDADFLFHHARAIMAGAEVEGPATYHAQVTLPPKGPARMERIAGDSEFPTVDPRVVGRSYAHVWTVGDGGPRTSPDHAPSVIRHTDLESGRSTRFDYGDGVMAEEHVFVPRPGASSEGDGWILGTSLDVNAATTRLSLFEATRIADGPVAQADTGRALPLGFHGAFSPA